MASTIKQRLRRFNGTGYDTVHLETDGSVVSVTIANTFINPLDTSDLTLGQHDVYFKAYPDIKWCVDHLDGDYVYLGLYNVSEKLAFGSDVPYKGSALAAKCETFLNTVIPNVADYLESVTVNSNNSDYAVTAKVFVPSGKMFTGSSSYSSVDSTDIVLSYPSASASNRVSMVSATTAGSNWTNLGGYIWSSSPNSGIYVKALNYSGSFSGYHLPSYEYGFRPEVKVRYKQSSGGSTITTDLNTALNNMPSALTFDTTPTEGSTNPVTSDGLYTALGNKVNATTYNIHAGNSNIHVTAAMKTTWNNKQNALTFDSTPTSDSMNPVTSGGIYTALSSKADASALTSHTGDSTIHVTSSEKSTWNSKQNALTFDSTPTSGSTNPVTSGGVYTALQSAGGGAKVYVYTFTAANWSSGTITIAAATHGITGSGIVANFYHLVDSVYTGGTWACVESWAEINASTHVITLHGPSTGYAGKVVLIG